MRNAIFRTLAGLIVIAAIWALGFTIQDSDSSTEALFGIWSLLLGLILIVPTFLIYAFKGEAAGNKVLVRALQILHLPERWLDRLVRKHVQLPPEFGQPAPAEAEPNRIGNTGSAKS